MNAANAYRGWNFLPPVLVEFFAPRFSYVDFSTLPPGLGLIHFLGCALPRTNSDPPWGFLVGVCQLRSLAFYLVIHGTFFVLLSVGVVASWFVPGTSTKLCDMIRMILHDTM